MGYYGIMNIFFKNKDISRVKSLRILIRRVKTLNNLIKLCMGCLITAIGILFIRHTNMITGGTAGLSLNLTYLFDLPFPIIFFIVNLPFYIFSLLTMGWKFTCKTIFAICLLTLLTALDSFIPIPSFHSFISALLGGAFMGIGSSIIFSNGASLGGAQILALFLQKKKNWDPGKTSFTFDFLVIFLSLFSIGITQLIISIFSIFITAQIISYFKNNISIEDEFNNKESLPEYPLEKTY
jgi:uncharacterized membrane-anchored protein YitT (DUF2179 family)